MNVVARAGVQARVQVVAGEVVLGAARGVGAELCSALQLRKISEKFWHMGKRSSPFYRDRGYATVICYDTIMDYQIVCSCFNLLAFF